MYILAILCSRKFVVNHLNIDSIGHPTFGILFEPSGWIQLKSLPPMFSLTMGPAASVSICAWPSSGCSSTMLSSGRSWIWWHLPIHVLRELVVSILDPLEHQVPNGFICINATTPWGSSCGSFIIDRYTKEGSFWTIWLLHVRQCLHEKRQIRLTNAEVFLCMVLYVWKLNTPKSLVLHHSTSMHSIAIVGVCCPISSTHISRAEWMDIIASLRPWLWFSMEWSLSDKHLAAATARCSMHLNHIHMYIYIWYVYIYIYRYIHTYITVIPLPAKAPLFCNSTCGGCSRYSQPSWNLSTRRGRWCNPGPKNPTQRPGSAKKVRPFATAFDHWLAG